MHRPLRNAVANIAVFTLMLFVGCGTDGNTDNTGPTGPNMDYCDSIGFSGSEETAILDTYHQTMRYELKTSGTEPFDALRIESYQNSAYNGPTGPGSYPLEGLNYSDCGLCVLAYSGCSGGTCDKTFFAYSGLVEIDSLGAPGTPFKGRLVNVSLFEVTIDDQWVSTPVADGDIWCADGYDFDIPLDQKMAEAVCVADGNGALMGDNISNYSLQNCNGDWVDLHSMCGQAKAVWMQMVAGWCTACDASVPVMAAYGAQNAGWGLRIMVILGEDESYNQPTLSYCQQYAVNHNVDPGDVYLDWGTEWGAWETTFSNIYPYASNGFGTPWNGVLRGSNMEYVHWDVGGSVELDTTITGLLAE